MSGRFLICGVPAVGKSQICRRVSVDKEWIDVNFADVMFQIGKQKKYIDRHAQLHDLPRDRRAELQDRALTDLGDKCGSECCLIQGHLLVEQDNRFVPGIVIGVDHVEKARLAGIGVIDAPTADIVHRREHDGNYKNYSRDPALIERHKRLNEMAAAYLAFRLGIPMFVIENSNGDNTDKAIEKAAMKVRDTIDKIITGH